MSESLEKLRTRILSDAKVKSEAIIKEADEKAEQVLREAREKAHREADEILARAEAEADAAQRSIISSRIRANRLRLLEERNKIVQLVLKDVQDRLASIATTRDFPDTVKKLTMEAVDAVGSDHPIVRVGFPKATKSGLSTLGDALPKGAKVEYDDKLGEEDMGGVVVSDPDGKVAYRNTFRARLDRLDRELLTLISSTIFGDQAPNVSGQTEEVAATPAE